MHVYKLSITTRMFVYMHVCNINMECLKSIKRNKNIIIMVEWFNNI